MHHRAEQIRKMLGQGPASHDVQDLEPATDREHRKVSLQRRDSELEKRRRGSIYCQGAWHNRVAIFIFRQLRDRDIARPDATGSFVLRQRQIDELVCDQKGPETRPR